MKILAFDTTNNCCSTSILIDEQIVSYNIIDESSRQAETLVLLIEQSLENANLKYNDLDFIACTIGPGSFTGVRIGIAAAKGFHLVTDIPLIGINNLELIAWEASQQINDDRDIIVCLNARLGQCYYQIFSKDLEAISQPLVTKLENLPPEFFTKDFIHAGDGFPLLNLEQESIVNYAPNAQMLANSLKFFLNKKQNSSFAPLYIREANITKAKPMIRTSL